MRTTDPLPRKAWITPDQLKVLNERAAWPWLKDALLDWTVMIGTADEAADRGVKVRKPTGTRARQPLLRRVSDAIRVVLSDFNPAFYPALAAAGILLVTSIAVLHYNYQRPRMSWIDALYFASETITTVGYGDFSFAQQSTSLRLFAVALMFGGASVTAILVAFLADLLLSRRFAHSAGRQRVRHLHNHVIVVGLGNVGTSVTGQLHDLGFDVVHDVAGAPHLWMDFAPEVASGVESELNALLRR